MNDDHPPGGAGARVAFLGNSMQYYNDCPRFLVNLGKGAISFQDSCFRGGASLSSLWEDGNGMDRKFATPNAATRKMVDDGEGGRREVVVYDVGEPTVLALLDRNIDDVDDGSAGGIGRCAEGGRWNYVVMNDHSQGPARFVGRMAAVEVLREKYLPLILRNRATPIIIETFAYRYHGIDDSSDLGSTTREFQMRVSDGVKSYVEALRSDWGNAPGSIVPRIAPVGTAFLRVHDEDHELWEGLFDPYDNFHPSPSGTFLQGCVLHWTMFGSPPPLPLTDDDIAELWRDARVMHDIRDGPIGPPLPSVKAAEYLWNVAREICSLDSSPM
ncbi:hypothetical protein ACHAXA_009584 [Cyclostephanos tholiformis]|uniref:Uncharacterized protein n=1 Tax=Cyclostephanos tholiformis TaxID=382380 RepID=A0ABD3R1Q5_9STRA